MTDQNDERSSLDMERRGDRFALVREYRGRKTELELEETEVLALARMIPSYARELTAQRHRAETGVYAWAAAPLKNYRIAMDMHSELILLKFTDDWECEFDFSFTASDARRLADAFVKWAEKLEQAPKISRQ
jgi:hypothetical protein